MEWQGKILSSSGNNSDYPSLQEAMDGGLFHPNCRHAINALSEADIGDLYEWNAKTQQYELSG